MTYRFIAVVSLHEGFESSSVVSAVSVHALTRGYMAKADSLVMHSESFFCPSMSEGKPGLICESFSDGIAKSTTLYYTKRALTIFLSCWFLQTSLECTKTVYSCIRQRTNS